MRLETEINDEVAKLISVLPYVPLVNYFGDNNHQQLQLVVYVLRRSMSKNEAIDYVYSLKVHPREWADMVIWEVLDAIDWMECRSSEPPSTSWAIFKPQLH